MSRAALALLFSLVLVPQVRAASCGGNVGEASDRIDAFIRSEMRRQKIPGVAVAIVEKGKVIKAQGYGLANLEHNVPVKPETIFQSGSLGKQFTSAAVMLLVEEGKLSLSDSLRKYFPDAPESWQPITIRHLLTHTSGIPDYTTESFDYRRDYTEDELAHLAFQQPLEFPAGSRWNYSNTGYALLGFIIHKASGQFYGDLLRDRVFAPLGMNTTRVISEEDIVPNRAAGYRLVKGEWKNQEWVAPKLNTTADGSLYFSVLDLIAWDRGLRSRALLSEKSWEQIFTPATLSSGKTYPYGFGWSLEEVGGQKVHQHGGSWQGFQTYLARYRGDDLTIIALANLAEARPSRIVEGVAAILDPRLAKPEPQPSLDSEPEVTARLRSMLTAAAQGKLSPDDFAFVRAGFFPTATQYFEELLREAGELQRLFWLERKELGDDRVYKYRAAFAGKTFDVTLALAPNNKVSQLWLEPK